VTDVWFDGNDMMGKIKALSTPSGEILKSLIKSGVQVGISSRGLGSVEEHAGHTYVQDDFQLICFDIVADPSTKGAFMQPSATIKESKELMGRIFTKADHINRILNDILED
jgi:predicted urease superfamily metal-dependent hydrolase